MFLQSDINKWRISQVDKLEKLYINSASTQLLQRPKNYFIQHNNGIFPNNSHINLRSYDAASSYHCTSPITGPNILKWERIFYCCSDCPRTNAPYL